MVFGGDASFYGKVILQRYRKIILIFYGSTGKSNLIHHLYPDALFIDFLKSHEQFQYQRSPAHLLDLLKANPKIQKVVLDEIQRVPELLDVVHQAIEAFPKKYPFIMTGSSSRKLKTAGVNLLGGRAMVRTLHPFLPSELGKDFNLEFALQFGLLPLIQRSNEPQEKLAGYLQLYIREEVKQEGLIRNLPAFTRFLEAVSFSQGQLLNLNEVSRECQTPRSTIEGYYSILKDLLLIHELPSFKKNNRKATVEHGKFYYFDVGVYRSIRPSGPLDRNEFITGASFETLVFQSLNAYLSYRNEQEQIYFWRSTTGAEVDFVFYGKNQFIAIEVKATRKLRPNDFKGLQSFSEDYPQAKKIILYGGSERYLKDDVLCIGLEEFLSELSPKKSILDF